MNAPHSVILPTFDDLANAQKLVEIQREHEDLKDGMVAWIGLIRDFITQAEACNFTDRHGHSLEMNAAYRALKDSVSE